MPRALRLLLTLFCVLVILAVSGAFVWLVWYSQERETELFAVYERVDEGALRNFHELREEIISDTVLNSFFVQPPSGERDAAEFLNHQFRWHSGEREIQGALAIPEETLDGLKAFGADWPQQTQWIRRQNLDYSWMKRLKEFDIWTLEKSGPLSEALAEIPELESYYFPVIEIQAVSWARLRLMQAAAEKGTRAAFEDVRELARLLATTGDLVNDILAVGVLRAEAEAWQAFRKQGRAPRDWKPVSIERLDRAQVFLRSLPRWAHFAVDPKKSDAILALPDLPGRCTALREGLYAQQVHRLFLERHYPERFLRFDTWVERWEGPCRLGAAARQWRERKSFPLSRRAGLLNPIDVYDWKEALKLRDVTRGIEQLAWVRRIPFLEKAIGLTLASMAAQPPLDPFTGP